LDFWIGWILEKRITSCNPQPSSLTKYARFELVSAPRSYTRDEGRPLGVGLQEQTSNRLKLHGLRALVVSVEGKDMAETMSGEVQGDERKRTTDEVSK